MEASGSGHFLCLPCFQQIEKLSKAKAVVKRLQGEGEQRSLLHTVKTEVLEMRFTAYFWAKCSHYQWHFLYLDFSVLKRRVIILF